MTIKQCLVVLAAKSMFHKVDMSYGMQMAKTQHLEAEWTPRQKWATYELILRHKGELASYGYDVTAVPVPPNPEEARKLFAVESKGSKGTDLVKSPGKRRVQMVDTGNYVVEFPKEPGLLEAFQRIPNRIRTFDEKNQWWKVRFNLQAIDGPALTDFRAFLSKWKFVAPPLVKADVQVLLGMAVKQEAERQQAYLKSYATTADIKLPELGLELRGFQKAGVAYCVEKKRAIIADEQGLGKTCQALAVVEHENAYPTLVVCKAALRGNWMKEIAMWLPRRKATRDINDMAYRDMQFLVLSYEGLVKYYDQLEALDCWKGIIVDEGQCIKTNKSKRSRACRDLAKFCKSPVRLVLTGTPIETTHYDLYPQLNFLDQMKAMGGADYFYEHFCGKDVRGARNGHELNALLRRVCYIRREKKDVLTELPPKQRSHIPLEIDNMPEYKQAETDIISWLRGEVARNPDKFEIDHDENDMVKDTSIQAKQDYVTQKASAAEALVKIGYLKALALKGMLEGAKQWIENFIESGEKLVVFCLSTDAQRQVWQMFKDVAVWTLDRPGPQAAVDRFQKDPKCKIIVCSIQADNAGHTLTAASNVVTLERWWTSTRHDQCEDRCHRIGQRDSVTCWYLVARGTIYEKIDALLESRRTMVAEATTGGGHDIAAGRASITKELLRNLAA